MVPILIDSEPTNINVEEIGVESRTSTANSVSGSTGAVVKSVSVYPLEHSQTYAKQAPMGKPKLVACLVHVDFHFFACNWI